ncbi:hypothetical protein [Novipirellula caenicola]|uniref:Transmembrane protein n=1 Tax=Novipirellula caenicola TaxID=1536901 RepID=A0ABP9VLQ9_9BACT
MKDDSAAAHHDDPTLPISNEPPTENEQPIMASLAAVNEATNASGPVDERAVSPHDPEIRVGSPFAKEPEPAPQPVRPEDVYFQATPLRYTSIGAVAAAGLVVMFALGGTVWFPAGGTLVAGLGCLLSIFGLYSHLRIAAASLLAVHLLLFVASYSRVWPTL